MATNMIEIHRATQLMYEIPPPFGFRDMVTYPFNFEEDE